MKLVIFYTKKCHQYDPPNCVLPLGLKLTKTAIFRIINSTNDVLKQSAFGLCLYQSFKAIQISEQLTIINYIHDLCDDPPL